MCQLINCKGILSAHSKFKQSDISESSSMNIDFTLIRVLKFCYVSSADFKLFYRFTTHLVDIVNNFYRFAEEILMFTNGTKFRAGRENCPPWIFNMCYISLMVILAILKFFEKIDERNRVHSWGTGMSRKSTRKTWFRWGAFAELQRTITRNSARMLLLY